MSQKIFLTSALAMGFVAPAFAETFPSNGYMQENKTYDNAATSTNMDGVYSGTVNAVAEYDIIDYIVNAGQYLPADSETVITCPAGSYCPGISGNVQYNQSAPQGIQTCPTGYASSAAGASSDTHCYRACDINNMGTSFTNIAHATAVSGNDYYGAGVDTCTPTACENGYHVDSGSLDLTTIIGEGEGEDYGYVANDDNGYDYYNKNTEKYGLNKNNDKGKFVVDFGNKGKLEGMAECGDLYSSLTCYCTLNRYISKDGETTEISSESVLSEDFVGYMGGGPEDDLAMCDKQCASVCAEWLSSYESFRAELFSSVTGGGSGTATCEANTITINWSDASAADISANNAGTATYGSDVRTPVKAATKKGKTFRGWRFSAPEQTNLPN